MPDKNPNSPLDFFDSVLAAHPLSEEARRSLADRIILFLQSLSSQPEHGGYIALTEDTLINQQVE